MKCQDCNKETEDIIVLGDRLICKECYDTDDVYGRAALKPRSKRCAKE